ncbi:type II toxin-antitoxin system HicB family antitoxin [Methylobacterium oryzisoli]|uniref:type II toxin-antitoxin system HicB family antitoxin n=1 Tax=Methylobacterium oryzisoli TaxID=3385502 RepID=UPI003891B0F7
MLMETVNAMANSYTYPARFRQVEQEAYLVDFPDLPEARTFGNDEAEAIAAASDCLREALRSRMRDQEEIPSPSALQSGWRLIAPPAELAAKVAVYEAFRRKGDTRKALADRLGVAEGEVRRVLDPNHRTKLGRLDEVAHALGGRLVVTFVTDPA